MPHILFHKLVRCLMPRDARQTTGGQVLVETALAAVGIVAIAFLITRVGLWLNDSLVQRNRNFQRTRLAAGSSNPGRPFDPVDPIHLIGPGAGSTGGRGPQPLGPSATPPACTGPGAGMLSQATDKRVQWLTKYGDATAKQEEVRKLSNKAEDLILAAPPSGPGGECSGDQCKGANWYWARATELQNLINAINTTQTALNNAQIALANARNALIAAQNALTNCESSDGGKDEFGNPIPPDCSAQQAAVNAAQIAYNNARAAVTNLQTWLNELNRQKTVLCANLMTGNPWVGGRPSSCTPPAVRTYAQQVNTKATSTANDVTTTNTTIRDMGRDLQTLILDAEDLERRGRAACASGRD